MIKPLYTASIANGGQYVYRFPNNYGASVVKHEFSYGYYDDMWEVAVIKFLDSSNTNWIIDYSTPLTKDVIGWVKWIDTYEILRDIMKLPPHKLLELAD